MDKVVGSELQVWLPPSFPSERGWYYGEYIRIAIFNDNVRIAHHCCPELQGKKIITLPCPQCD